ncbi:MAG: ABC transporter ATP-binding protein, partial [Dehalococcoidia bacterium]|nr:ABC transporter ATP-binding protein [Dehalococcoidia bacterium]
MLVVERVAAGTVSGASFTVTDGEMFVILGAAGSGKTALLRAVAGLEPIADGHIAFNGDPITHAPPGARPTVFVARSAALFPNLSVFDNIAFGPRLRSVAAQEVRERVEHLLRQIGLGERATARPDQLTAEEQWRVGLARAVAIEPKVLIVDEPEGEPAVGLALAKALAGRIEASVLAATTDRTAALSVADRVAFLRNGRIEQIGAPMDLYYRPMTPYVADYVSRANLAPCVVDSIGGSVLLVSAFGRRFGAPLDSCPFARSLNHGDPLLLVIRPEAIRFVPTGDGLPAVITRAAFLGPAAAYEVKVDGWSLSMLDPDL